MIPENKFVMVGETRWCCIELDRSAVAQDPLHHLFSQEDKKPEEKRAEKVLTAKQGKKNLQAWETAEQMSKNTTKERRDTRNSSRICN